MSFNALIPRNLCRILHTSCINNAAIHKTFRKVLGISESHKKRKLVFENSPAIRQGFPSSDKGKATNSRRAAMLNKMFMIHITDLMVNGENWDNYTKWGIEITSVKVSSDYKMLNIYYISKSTVENSIIESFLNENAFSLRHELSQLRVMGVVPPISFIKDRKESQIVELDKSIATADFGEDYQPAHLTRLKHKLQLYTKIDDVTSKKIESLEETECFEDSDLPEMPQSVLGLNHAEILKRLEKNDKKTKDESKSKVVMRNYENGEIPSSKDAFKVFLQKRQVLSKKRRKEDKNYNPDMEYIKQEILEKSSRNDYFENIEKNFDNNKDYIDDEK